MRRVLAGADRRGMTRRSRGWRSGSGGWRSRRGGTRERVPGRRRRIRRRRGSSGGRRRARRLRSCWPGRDARREAGGQEGHPGAGRELAPEDQVDEIVAHYPQACRGCGREFTEDERRVGWPVRPPPGGELPPISVLLVEHRTHRLRCPECATRTTASLPAGVAGSAFGPRLRAAIVTLTARNRISRRGIAELACELFGAAAVDRQRRRDLPARQRRAGRRTRDAARLDPRPGRAARR